MSKIHAEGHISKNLSTELLESGGEIVLPGLIFLRPVIGVDKIDETPFVFSEVKRLDTLDHVVKVRSPQTDPHIIVTRRLTPDVGLKVSIRIPLDQHS